MSSNSKPPKQYVDFIEQYPKLGEAWDRLHEAEAEGPLDERTARLVKLAVAVGALKEGAVRASVRKALKAGLSPAELHQVVALSAATLGLPSAVAAFGWIRQALEPKEEGR